MELDSEDRLLPERNPGPQHFATLAQAARAAFFDGRSEPVRVVVKKRRIADEQPSQSGSTPPNPASGDDDGERKPRVFVLHREAAGNAPDADGSGDNCRTPVQSASGLRAGANEPVESHALAEPARNRRRRRQADHRPSPVVHIVLPRPEPAPADPTRATPQAEEAASDVHFALELPANDTWRDLQEALTEVRRLVHDAESASRWNLAPVARRQRTRAR